MKFEDVRRGGGRKPTADERGHRLALQKAAHASLTDAYLWVNLGHLTGSIEYVEGHDRLLRSLRFGDDDYLGHAYATVAQMLEADPDNLAVLLDYEPIAEWMRIHEPDIFRALGGGRDGRDIPAAELGTSVATVDAAIADAEVLIGSGGHGRAIDRVHTALHAYLRYLCLRQGVGSVNASAPELLKLLLANHAAFAGLAPRGGEVLRVLRTLANVVDTLGTLRNNNSPAHPNDDLLDQAEARLVINSAKTVLAYIKDKLDSFPS